MAKGSVGLELNWFDLKRQPANGQTIELGTNRQTH